MRFFGLAVLVAVLGGAVSAAGYNFLFWDGQSFRVVGSEEAFRWDESEFPLRFRMLENDSLAGRCWDYPGELDRDREA